jgi:anaerobic magnesium-protoporphyrin IX monomethyl ester cyclase
MSVSVVLVSPPNTSMLDPRIGPPLGLLYLVAWAQHVGDDTDSWRVVDLNVECYQPDAPVGHDTHDFSIDRCMREIPTGADVYGLQLASMQMPHGVAIAQRLREREPNALLVCGGSHASAMPDECAEWFDVVIEREGESAFVEVLAWASNTRRAAPQSWRPVLSPSPLGWSFVVQHAPIEPLDSLPFPARDKLDWSRYTRKVGGGTATNIITTRGCPARCNFCQQESLWGKGLRMMTAPRILREVDNIKQVTGITNLLFLDDSLTARKRSDMIALCEGLAERGVLWRGWTHANLLARNGEDEVLKLMSDAGCQAICVGVEAGSDRVLKAMQKGTTTEQNSIALNRVHQAGMSARCSIMVGNPGETWADVEALIKFVERHRHVVTDWILSSYVPLPGTPSWDNPEKFGMVIDKAKARRELYRHFFVVGGDEQSGMVHSYEGGITPADIQDRHDYVQETLLRLAPRDRVLVTKGAAA